MLAASGPGFAHRTLRFERDGQPHNYGAFVAPVRGKGNRRIGRARERRAWRRDVMKCAS
jgi:hypothetical protein